MDTSNIKSQLLLFNHDLVVLCVVVKGEVAFLDRDLELLSLELVDMLQIDKFFQLERVQDAVNLFDFLAFELADCEGIEFLDTEELAGFGDLPVKFFDLLGEGFLILFLLVGQLANELLFLRLFLLILCFSLLELL